MTHDYFTTAIGHYIWDTKYRYRDGDVVRDHTLADSWRRIARWQGWKETLSLSGRVRVC